ncbi:MAG: endonuclease/exonuclease/phosphatase family protein [Gemmatimonadales bacterium]
MTFNIFHDAASAQFGIEPWDVRRGLVAATIAESEADVVGLQEAYPWQVEWLEGELPGYAHVGRGRNADGSGESVAILFRADRFTLEESGHFWLSPTPDEPGSSGGDAWGGMRVPRVVTWARLGFGADDREVYVFNTHLPANDSGGPEARRQTAIVLAERIAARSRPDVPFVLLGDFNSAEDEFPIRYLKREASSSGEPLSPVAVVDSWRVLNAGGAGTRCRNDATGAAMVHGTRVDYVLVMDTTRVDEDGVDRSTADGVLASVAVTPTASCASDHLAVWSRFVVP